MGESSQVVCGSYSPEIAVFGVEQFGQLSHLLGLIGEESGNEVTVVFHESHRPTEIKPAVCFGKPESHLAQLRLDIDRMRDGE